MKIDLYLDFDSTIVNSEKAICQMYNEKYSGYEDFIPAEYTQTEDWSFRNQCPLIHSLEDEPIKYIQNMFGSDEFFEKLEFYDKALESIEKLAEKYNLLICTSGTPLNVSKKVLWIDENLDVIKELLFVINKEGKGYGKRRVAMLDGGSIFIDDHPSNLDSTKAHRKILYKYKESNYNKEWDGEIVSSWSEIMELLF